MGNDQSSPSQPRSPRSHGHGSQSRRSRQQPQDGDHISPPPYTLMDASIGSGRPAPSSPPRTGGPVPPPPPASNTGDTSRPLASQYPVNPAPSGSFPTAPSAPASHPQPYVGGFRIEADPWSQPGLPISTPAVPAVPAQSTDNGGDHSLRRRNTHEDLLEMLRKFKTVLVVDDSSSMAGRRWTETGAALAELVGTAAGYDLEGIDIHFLNSPVVGKGVKDAPTVEWLFKTIDPDGITPTGEKLEILLLDYILQIEDAQDRDRKDPSGQGTALKDIKPLNLIVLTDGEPTDDPESVIVTAAKRLDSRHFPLSQVGIQFVQIGDDPRATEALKELDEALAGQHGIRDMVDTTPYVSTTGQLSSRTLAKMLLGGVNRRVDKRGAE